jgi:hypothetical protein
MTLRRRCWDVNHEYEGTECVYEGRSADLAMCTGWPCEGRWCSGREEAWKGVAGMASSEEPRQVGPDGRSCQRGRMHESTLGPPLEFHFPIWQDCRLTASHA